ncbi:hypothetical protein S40285_02271 [Stachybotrys chlorohalonatus IBT 40285]|uniref:Mevalonate kinase n=1 Tax=Stachybotrys chlorohalonatus (strain IBT 40285) TaxID=1283841 RepID=A0A084QG14_STAC4|nr:hypothetical protein S40285_02271 [Stachybotrys chlorohalonata IBT 40285]
MSAVSNGIAINGLAAVNGLNSLNTLTVPVHNGGLNTINGNGHTRLGLSARRNSINGYNVVNGQGYSSQNGHNGLHGSNGLDGYSGHNGSSYHNGHGHSTHTSLLSERKTSSPMAPPFMVSAPGKVIVFGEHSVVHGKVSNKPNPPFCHLGPANTGFQAAVAAAISLRSYLHVTTLSKFRRTVTLRFPDIDLVHTWNIDDLPWDAFQNPLKKKSYYSMVTELDPDLVAALQPHILSISPDYPEELRKVHQNSASAFLYLFLSLGSPSFPGCLYTLRSTIPIGAGLGSSASISVCMSAALLVQLRTLSGPHPDQPYEEARLQLERINRWAFVSEMCIHGNPSGVDNTVATQGKAVVFQRTDYSRPPLVRPLWDFPELPLLLVNTRQAKSTAHEVAKVAKLKDTHPKLVNAILDAMDKVSTTASGMIERNDFAEDEEASHKKMGDLMTVNHGLLVSLGVSHPRLERVRELVDHEGIGWTKLTGAGGGGCSITLLRSDVPRHKLTKLEHQLETENYEKFETTLGGDGVGVLWPAILKNGTDEDEEGGMEIDLEKFLNAEGTEGVEKLVGVHGHGGEREGWKFWRVETR